MTSRPSGRAAAISSPMCRPTNRTRGASNITSKASFTRTTVPSASTIITPSARDSMIVACRRSTSRTCCSRLLALGDVTDVDDDPADGVVEMVGRHHLEVDGLPVGPHRAHLEGHRQPAPSHQVVEEGADRLDAHRVEQPEGIEADDVADVVAEEALGRCTDEDEPTVRRRSPPPRRSPAPRWSGTEVRPVGRDPFGPMRSGTGRRGDPRPAVSVGRGPTRTPEGLELGVAGEGAALVLGHETAARSASHRGWNTCHWSGACRISPSNRVAIPWVSRATSWRRDP